MKSGQSALQIEGENPGETPKLNRCLHGSPGSSRRAVILLSTLGAVLAVRVLVMSSSSSSTETNLSVAALAVALAALIIALGQILGQYFGTADGYRRCQSSVMGPWAKHTRLAWRWTQFRFETLFTTPQILVQPAYSIQKPAQGVVWVGHCRDLESKKVSRDGTVNELVCWLPFLQAIYSHETLLSESKAYGSTASASYIAIQDQERSWDFMPSDIIRPTALSCVGDVAVIVMRLGMIWTDFRLEDGLMRAEGNGHVISSTLARSLGVVLHYMHVEGDGSSDRNQITQATYIPTRKADMMMFGIISPPYSLISEKHFTIGHIDEIYATMDRLDPSRRASRKIRDVRGIEPSCTFGFSDLISMGSDMLRQRGSRIIRLPIPSEYCVGLTCHKEGFVVFYCRLKQYIAERTLPGDASDQIKWICGRYEALKEQYPEWEDEALANEQRNSRNVEFLDTVQSYWDSTTKYFLEAENDKQKGFYYNLMAMHISHAVNYWGDAWSNIRNNKTRDHFGMRDWVAEGAHLYWDYVPHICTDMRKRGFDFDDERIYEAWITMMFRAFCWWRCHYMIPGEDMPSGQRTLPSRYWNSKQPVYIG